MEVFFLSLRAVYFVSKSTHGAFVCRKMKPDSLVLQIRTNWFESRENGIFVIPNWLHRNKKRLICKSGQTDLRVGKMRFSGYQIACTETRDVWFGIIRNFTRPIRNWNLNPCPISDSAEISDFNTSEENGHPGRRSDKKRWCNRQEIDTKR